MEKQVVIGDLSRSGHRAGVLQGWQAAGGAGSCDMLAATENTGAIESILRCERIGRHVVLPRRRAARVAGGGLACL